MKIPAGKSFVTFLFVCLCAISVATFSACDAPKSDEADTNNKPDDETDGGEDSTEVDGTDGETDGETDGTDSTVSTELEGIFVESVDMPEDKEYLVGDEISFGLNFTDTVDVEGNPEITFYVGPTTTQQTTPIVAIYASGTGTKVLTFTYTVEGGHLSPFGLKLDDEPLIDLADGSLSGTDDVNLSLVNFGDTKKLKIIEGLEDNAGAYRFHGGDVAASCTEYLKDARYAGEENGVYWLANPVDASSGPIQGVCDMKYDNGYGWLLVLNYAFPSGSYASAPGDPAELLPVVPDGLTLGDDYSADTAVNGHASAATVEAFAPELFRYRCQAGADSANADTLSFRLQQAECDTANQPAGSGAEVPDCNDGDLLEKYTEDSDNDATVAGSNPIGADPINNVGESAYFDMTTTPLSFDDSANWTIGAGSWQCAGSGNTDDHLFQGWIRN